MKTSQLQLVRFTIVAVVLHSASATTAGCVCPPLRGLSPPISITEIACTTVMPSDNCEVLRFLGFVTQADKLLRTVFKDMLVLQNLNGYGEFISDGYIPIEFVNCFPPLPKNITTTRLAQNWQKNSSCYFEVKFIYEMKNAVINGSILFRNAIKSISNNNEYRASIGREYFETAYFALTQQLFCPLKSLASGTLASGHSINGTDSGQPSQSTSCGRLSSTNLYKWHLIKHLENLVTMINWNVGKMMTMIECS